MRALKFLLVAALLSACATPPVTRVVASWKDPDVGVVDVGRALLVFQHNSEPLRRNVEDALAARIPGAVPAYTMFSTDEIFNVDLVRDRVREAGFESVIVTRLIDVDEEVTWNPGAPSRMYGPLWGHWGYGWSSVYDPGYLERTTVVTTESLVYSLAVGEGELIWAIRSETFDPTSIDDLAAGVVRASTRAMEKEGIFVVTR
jgi:hypothetical protein